MSWELTSLEKVRCSHPFDVTAAKSPKPTNDLTMQDSLNYWVFFFAVSIYFSLPLSRSSFVVFFTILPIIREGLRIEPLSSPHLFALFFNLRNEGNGDSPSLFGYLFVTSLHGSPKGILRFFFCFLTLGLIYLFGIVKSISFDCSGF